MDYKTLINIFSTLKASADIKRYSRDRLTDSESVLEHVGWVCMFATFLAENYERTTGLPVDYSKLLRRCVLHDLDETVTGDVPRPTKYYDGQVTEAFKMIEKKGVSTILDSTGVTDRPFYDWENAKDVCIEGLILKLSDLFAAAYKCWQEILMYNNMSFIRVMRESHQYVDKLFNELLNDSKWNDVLQDSNSREFLKEAHRSISRIYEDADSRSNVMNVDKISTQFFLSDPR